MAVKWPTSLVWKGCSFLMVIWFRNQGFPLFCFSSAVLSLKLTNSVTKIFAVLKNCFSLALAPWPWVTFVEFFLPPRSSPDRPWKSTPGRAHHLQILVQTLLPTKKKSVWVCVSSNWDGWSWAVVRDWCFGRRGEMQGLMGMRRITGFRRSAEWLALPLCFLFTLKDLFIFWLCWVFVFTGQRLSLAAEIRDYFLTGVCRLLLAVASHCSGFSCLGARL